MTQLTLDSKELSYVLFDVVFLLSLPVPGPQGNDTGGDNHTAFYIMMVWIVIAFVLYLLR